MLAASMPFSIALWSMDAGVASSWIVSSFGMIVLLAAVRTEVGILLRGERWRSAAERAPIEIFRMADLLQQLFRVVAARLHRLRGRHLSDKAQELPLYVGELGH